MLGTLSKNGYITRINELLNKQINDRTEIRRRIKDKLNRTDENIGPIEK